MANHILAAMTLVLLSTGMDWETSDPQEVQVTTSSRGTFSAEIPFLFERTLWS